MMTLDMPFTVVEDKGSVYFDSFSDLDMRVNVSWGNMLPQLNHNKLYEVRGSLGAWQFRFGSAVYLNNTNTYIYNVKWNNGQRPLTGGLYNFRVLQSERKEVFGRTFCMIGDSITWWERGGDFRHLLRMAGLKYDFAGMNTDPYGYRHCGNGGFNTDQTLAIMNDIPVADTYFILIGTNDRGTPQRTYDNILKIVDGLKAKDCCCRVYVSTLLPRNDGFNTNNEVVNALLRGNTSLPSKTKLIDAYKVFASRPNWTTLLNDGLHPNANGYRTLVNGIIAELK